jgi:glycosyltransferase involved in cell wall biosynthesis
MVKLSIIIPVYNRPDEVAELLASLGEALERREAPAPAWGFASEPAKAPIAPPLASGEGNFPFSIFHFPLEIIIVEDGSTRLCEEVVKRWNEKSSLGASTRAHYYFKPNSGPGPSRNYGAERATGDYLVFLDSDVIVPEGWLEAVARALPMDLWGGPDRAAANFTPLQKAIDYAMTSPLTTGGIRGRRKSVGRFFPRSFNMGVRREVFEAVGGFAPMRFGEDIDLSYRIVEAGYEPQLVPDAWVWHKRRTRWRQFFKQVFNSGAARVELSRRHRGTLKPLHLLPTAFVVGCAALLVAAFWWPWLLLGFAAFGIIVGIDATARTRNLRVGMLSVAASFVQLTGYGSGFIYGLLRRRGAFVENFYK